MSEIGENCAEEMPPESIAPVKATVSPEGRRAMRGPVEPEVTDTNEGAAPPPQTPATQIPERLTLSTARQVAMRGEIR